MRKIGPDKRAIPCVYICVAASKEISTYAKMWSINGSLVKYEEGLSLM
jgi:hypothetical protein